MAKLLRCNHVGPDANCQFVAQGETDEEVLNQLAEHARTDHGMAEIPDELVQIAISKIQNEESD